MYEASLKVWAVRFCCVIFWNDYIPVDPFCKFIMLSNFSLTLGQSHALSCASKVESASKQPQQIQQIAKHVHISWNVLYHLWTGGGCIGVECSGSYFLLAFIILIVLNFRISTVGVDCYNVTFGGTKPEKYREFPFSYPIVSHHLVSVSTISPLELLIESCVLVPLLRYLLKRNDFHGLI